MPHNRHTGRIVFCCFGLGLCLFLFISLVSFHATDWPNPDVAPASADGNLCGPAGAFLAYYINYYLGPAAMAMLAGVVIWLLMYCMQRKIGQFVLRSIGVVLTGAALATGVYLFTQPGANSLSHGNGGVLGIAMGHFLLVNTARTGTILILLACLVVGLLLAADNVVIGLLKLIWLGMMRIKDIRPVPAGAYQNGRVGNSGIRAGRKVGRKQHKQRLVVPISQQEAAIQEVLGLGDKPVDGQDEQDEYWQEDEGEYEYEYEDDESDSGDEDMDQQYEQEQLPVTGSDYRNRKNSKRLGKKARVNGKIGGKDCQSKQREQLTSVVPSALAKMLGHKIPSANSSTGGIVQEDFSDYSYPPLEILEEPVHGYSELQEKVVRERSAMLEQTLREFNIDARVVETESGPVITMFELELSPGIKVSQITNLSNDLARSLGAGSVRVVAPIPGKHTIGIEVPNSAKEKVRIKELINLAGNRPAKMQIPLFLGKDAHGDPLISDLATMPHLLIAGTTGSGKSICINSIIVSILLTQRPDMVKLILVDPKMVEMNAFRGLAHLMCPIVTEMKRAEQILEWLTVKMDERYALLAEAGVRNIAEYNKLSADEIYQRFSPSNDEEKNKIPVRLPYIVIIIDELADLMMTSAKEVESHIIRLAQKSRAIGIHIVLATQRPQATVVTGLIKSNLPCRISFRVAGRMDSRIVLDQNGAETLLGQGDMLFLKPGTSDLTRAQGTFMSDKEIHGIVKYLKETAQPHYHPELVQMNQLDGASNMERDELFDEAVQIVLQTRRGSVSLLQRRLTIGYSRASRLIDQMAMAGIVGEYKGSQAREVLISQQEYDAIKRQMARDKAQGYSDLQEEDDATAASSTQADETCEVAIETEDEDIAGDDESVDSGEDNDADANESGNEYEDDVVDGDGEEDEYEEYGEDEYDGEDIEDEYEQGETENARR